MVLAACGGDDSGPTTTAAANDNDASQTSSESSNDNSSDSGGGQVVDVQPPGQASASVEGEQYTFDTVGPVGCDITDSEFNVGFLKGDNEVSFIAGGSGSGSDWRGRIDVNVQTTDGIVNYFAELSSGAVAVDGQSMSYSGEWQVLRPGESEAQSVGDGTLSVTCG